MGQVRWAAPVIVREEKGKWTYCHALFKNAAVLITVGTPHVGIRTSHLKRHSCPSTVNLTYCTSTRNNGSDTLGGVGLSWRGWATNQSGEYLF